MEKTLRTHTCGELTAAKAGSAATLTGWVHTRRDHGGIIFIDIRDRYGFTQVVFEPAAASNLFSEAEAIRREWVVQVSGKVRKRDASMVNSKISTGEIELVAEKLIILNKSEVPPFSLDEWSETNETLRLKYRYIDLRRHEMQRHFIIRHKASIAVRNFLSGEGFLEIETPMLVRSTPEGARDFVVPSRMNPGTFYALPQSPQLYKQLLMVSGMDRYFQIARCMRDEDLRADRQPEFTQIDIEASFINEEFIYDTVERMLSKMFKDAADISIAAPFTHLTHAEAMAKYGCDKPDLRFDLPLTDVTDIAKASDFSVFKAVTEKGGIVKCIAPKHDFSKGDLEDLIAFCQSNGAKGMAWMRVTDNGLESNIVKYFNADIQKKLLDAVKPEIGATLMFIADKPKACNDIISRLRNELGKRMGLIKADKFAFCWVTDFPMFEYDEKDKSIVAAHHIFTAPNSNHLDFLETEPLKVTARSYDLVLNGIEVASGSIRIHDSEMQKRVLKVIGVSEEEASKKFGFLLEAFKFGAPPHGGIAPGFDRLIALMCGFNDIREVIAFPKTQSGTSLLDGCPSEIDAIQMRDLKLKSLAQIPTP
ncbi:MAG: aspartate--tRNA ligase [Fibrobacteres bacterium]|nr:aspartate--tRNA ligase [Fibrobacterota bacterium]